ncbi:hypothetical protein [Thermus scotoductus]|nr:hypothetical protein [Thermus scotoductus]
MRQAGLSLLVGIGIGLTAAFLLVAHDRSRSCKDLCVRVRV